MLQLQTSNQSPRIHQLGMSAIVVLLAPRAHFLIQLGISFLATGVKAYIGSHQLSPFRRGPSIRANPGGRRLISFGCWESEYEGTSLPLLFESGSRQRNSGSSHSPFHF